MSREPLAARDGKDDSFVTVSVNSLLSPERPINNTRIERFFSCLWASVCYGLLSIIGCKTPSYSQECSMGCYMVCMNMLQMLCVSV